MTRPKYATKEQLEALIEFAEHATEAVKDLNAKQHELTYGPLFSSAAFARIFASSRDLTRSAHSLVAITTQLKKDLNTYYD